MYPVGSRDVSGPARSRWTGACMVGQWWGAALNYNYVYIHTLPIVMGGKGGSIVIGYSMMIRYSSTKYTIMILYKRNIYSIE